MKRINFIASLIGIPALPAIAVAVSEPNPLKGATFEEHTLIPSRADWEEGRWVFETVRTGDEIDDFEQRQVEGGIVIIESTYFASTDTKHYRYLQNYYK